MISLRPGTSINIPYLNRLQERAQRGNIAVAGAGITGQDTPGGMVFAQNPQAESWPDCQRMYYRGDVTGEILLPGSLVHIIYASAVEIMDITGSGNVTFDVADYSGRSRLGILREGAAPGDCPMVQYQGLAPLLVDYSTVPPDWQWLDTEINSTKSACRLGARMHSPYAQWDDNGPLLLVGVGNIIPDNWPSPPANVTVVAARISVPFAGQVYCYPVARTAIPATEGGAYRCWNMGPDFNVVEVAPGDITI